MRDEKEKVHFCSDCKHFVYVANVAHQNQCKKFKEDGKPQPCAVVRVEGGKCDCGSGWEK